MKKKTTGSESPSSKKNDSPKYTANRKVVCISFSTKEQALLEKKMHDEDWSNTGGFIKNTLFGDDIDEVYQNMLSESDKDGILIIMKVLLENFSDELIYSNYRMRDIFEFYEKKSMNSALEIKNFKRVGMWRNNLEKKIDNLLRDVRLLLHHYDVDIKGHENDKIRGLPQKLIDEKLKNWDDNQSPEIIEHARRIQKKEK